MSKKTKTPIKSRSRRITHQLSPEQIGPVIFDTDHESSDEFSQEEDLHDTPIDNNFSSSEIFEDEHDEEDLVPVFVLPVVMANDSALHRNYNPCRRIISHFSQTSTRPVYA